MLDKLAIGVALAGTGITAWQDYRTGYLSDKITVPMIGAGVLLAPFIFPDPVLAYVTALGVFLLGFAGYAFGQIGGGDVLLFTALALLVPGSLANAPSPPYPPVVSVFLIAGLIGPLFFTPLKTHYRLYKKRNEIKDYWKKLAKGILLGSMTFPLFVLYSQVSPRIWLLAPFFVLGFSISFFKLDVLRLFCLKAKRVSEVDEEEIIATEFIPEHVRKKLGIKRRTLIGKELERMKEKASEEGVEEIPVYENVPVFVPSILAALVLYLVFGDVFFLAVSPV